MGDDASRARPIPQRHRAPGPRPVRPPVEDPYEDAILVDTRGKRRYAAGSPRGIPSPQAPPPQRDGGDASGGPRPPRVSRPARAPRAPRPPGTTRRWWLRGIGLALGLFLVYLIAVPSYAYEQVARVDATPADPRPAAGVGANYLLIGSDSRAGMTEEQQQQLATGADEGSQRADTIMVLHHSASGPSTLVSIPRDSYVEIPGHGMNKINAAYAFGGAKLLATTVERATGLRLDGSLEIGFGGFAGLVDAVGGVDICVESAMNDPRAGINLQPGCQTLDGPNALGYVRSRYLDPRGDLGRSDRQRAFLSALMSKIARPSTVLLPWRYWAVCTSGARGVQLGEDTSLGEVIEAARTLKSVSGGNGHSLVVPVANVALRTRAGLAVSWDTAKAKALFGALQRDEPLTASQVPSN